MDKKITLIIPKDSAIDMGRYWATEVTRQALMELAVAQIPEGKVAIIKREAE